MWDCGVQTSDKTKARLCAEPCKKKIIIIFLNSIHKYFRPACSRASSEHLNILDPINRLSVLTSRSHSFPFLSFCLLFASLFPLAATHKAIHSKAVLLQPQRSPEGSMYRRAAWDWSESQDGEPVGLLPLWWRGSAELPLTLASFFAQSLMMEPCSRKKKKRWWREFLVAVQSLNTCIRRWYDRLFIQSSCKGWNALDGIKWWFNGQICEKTH